MAASSSSVDNAISEGKGYGIALAWAGVKNLGLTGSWSGEPSAKTAAGIDYQDFRQCVGVLPGHGQLGLQR